MRRGKLLKRFYLTGILCCLILILLLPSCSRHCYLCQGIPCDAPCLVDLSTGQAVELSATNDPGSVTWTSLGAARVSLKSNRALVIIPTDDRVMNLSLFCNDCQALLSELPDSRYIISDMYDLNNLTLYPVQADGSYTIREYEVTVTANADGSHIEVTRTS